MGNSPGQAITIPEDEVIRDEDVQREGQPQPSEPSWGSRAWDKVKHFTGLDEGVLFGGSGEAGGIAGAPRTYSDVLTPLTYPALSMAGEAAGPYLNKLLPKEASSLAPFERDATALNKVPFAGEEMESGVPSWRDATKLNEPYAGEAPETGWHSKLPNVRPTGTQEYPGSLSSLSKGPTPRIGASAGTAPSLGASLKPGGASFDLPSTVPEKASIPGAGGESWSMQRKVTPQLQQAASAGDPGAIQTMRRLNPSWSPVITPAGAGEYPQTRLGGSFEERMGTQAQPAPIASPGASQGLPQGRQNLFEIASPERRQVEGISPTGTERRQFLDEANQFVRKNARPIPRTPAEADAETQRQMDELIPPYMRRKQ